jgi:hypothetical protein
MESKMISNNPTIGLSLGFAVVMMLVIMVAFCFCGGDDDTPSFS